LPVQRVHEWTIRRGRDEDVGELVELLRICLGEGQVPRSAEFWRWKHQRSPFGPSPFLVAIAGGRIIGFRAFLGWRWHTGERALTAVRAVDTATHPQWQGCGVFSRLTQQLVAQLREEGVAFVFNTPNRKSGSGYRKMGWHKVGRLPVYGRLLGIPRRRRRNGGPSSSLRPIDEFLARAETPSFLAAVDRRRSEDRRLRTATTLPYLRWRYAEAPGLDYRAAWSGSGDEAAALVVRLRRRRGLLEASVSELLAANEAGARTAAQLLRGLAGSTPAHYALAVASTRTTEHAALRRAGFLRLPAAGPRLAVRRLALDTDAPNLLESAAWRLSTGTFELF
jgi:GNAT superfamily N-acetyltransferase